MGNNEIQGAVNEGAVLSPLDVLRRDGWCKRVAHAVDGRVCILGAMGRVWPDAWEDRRFKDFAETVRSVIEEQFPERFRANQQAGQKHPIAVFNDSSHTTVLDVELVLEKAELRFAEGSVFPAVGSEANEKGGAV